MDFREFFLAYKGTEIIYRNLLNQNNQAYVAAGMKIVRVLDRTAMYFYHTDALGSTRMITYNDASYVFIDNHQPFGKDNGTPRCESCQPTPPFKFTGKPWMSSTSLYYNYQTWYDSSIGRFISRDPDSGTLTAPQTFNGYSYATNSPTTLRDPSGLSVSKCCYTNLKYRSCPMIWEDPWGSLVCSFSPSGGLMAFSSFSAAAGPPGLVIVGLYLGALGIISPADLLASRGPGSTVIPPRFPRAPTTPVQPKWDLQAFLWG